MTESIRRKLHDLEDSSGFRVLYACESGSRAWGFASSDSDYDVRVIYVWPRDRYLGIFPPPDTLDLGVDRDDLDVSCWDLRKALPLFRKANGPLFEWLFSPVVYLEDDEVMRQWRQLVDDYFVPGHSASHYLGLSRKINGGIRDGARPTAKKYLYVLRALLSATFVVEHRAPPPVNFDHLRERFALPPEVDREIDAMIAEKAEGSEGDRIPRNDLLDGFIDERSQAVTDAVSALPSEMGPIGPLDEFYRSVLS